MGLGDNLDESEKAQFGFVLGNLKEDHLPSFATSLRRFGHNSTKSGTRETPPEAIQCRLLPEVKRGSYHAVIELSFDDGISWILKVPAKGHGESWDAAASRALVSEAQTMRLVRRETTIPIPEVFAFDGSINSELGCPYILMGKVEGKPLYQRWFDHCVSRPKNEQFRLRALQGIADATVQFQKFNFDKGGSLVFDSDGKVLGIASRNKVDFNACYETVCKKESSFDSTPFCEVGPFSDVKSYFLTKLDEREGKRQTTAFNQGLHELLRLFIDWSLNDDTQTLGTKPFVLGHPDFDSQNIFVAEDGTLTGIIDWDWVAAVPHSVGYLKLPSFLTRDYEPMSYGWDAEKGRPMRDCDECSPEELSSYRAMYAHFIEMSLSKGTQYGLEDGQILRATANVESSAKEASNVTRRSLVMATLDEAADAPVLTMGMICHMFEEIEKLTESGNFLHSSDTNSDTSSDSDDNAAEHDDVTETSDGDAKEDDALEILLKEAEKLIDMRIDDEEANHLSRVESMSGAPPSEDISSLSEAEEALSPRQNLGKSLFRWGAMKFQGIAGHMKWKGKHSAAASKRPNLVKVETSAKKSPKLKPREALHRYINSFEQHNKSGADNNEDTQIEGVQKRGPKAILTWLKEKFTLLLRLILRQNETKVSHFQGSNKNDSMKRRSGHGSGVFEEYDTHIAGYQIVQMLAMPGNPLSREHKLAIARWLVRILKAEGTPSDLPRDQNQITTSEFADLSYKAQHHLRTRTMSNATSQKPSDSAQKDSMNTEDMPVNQLEGRSIGRIKTPSDSCKNFRKVKTKNSRAMRPQAAVDLSRSDSSHSSLPEKSFRTHNHAEDVEPVGGDISKDGSICQVFRFAEGELNDKRRATHPDVDEGIDNHDIVLEDEDGEDDRRSLIQSLYGVKDGEKHVDELSGKACGKGQKEGDVVRKAGTAKRFHKKLPSELKVSRPISPPVTPLATIPEINKDIKAPASDVGEALHADEKDYLEDWGGFNVYEVAIALAKGKLDEQRMVRLKAGFLALLNQT